VTDAHIQLIVGLGNPGAEYEHTRHNVGADLVAELARQHNGTLKFEPKFYGLTGRINIDGHDVRLLIPTTFMNRSGQAVSAMVTFFKFTTTDILVVHDELDIETGTARLKLGGGPGGHNGLRDIISSLSNNKDFARLRIGIGHPGAANKVTGHVLNRAGQEEQLIINATIDESIRVLPDVVTGKWSSAMNRLHSFKG